MSIVRTLDRYLIREIIPPFLIALGVYTFILDVMPLLDAASDFLAKGVAPATIARLLLLLLPQALGLTIPMAFLTGLLMALGRISGDREAMAMLACGVSPLRLCRPVMVAALGAGLLTLYVMVWLLPDCNQRYNDIGWRLLTERTEQEVKPGQFYSGFPGKVLFVQSSNAIDGWGGVFMADTSRSGPPSVAMAESGRLYLNRAQQQVVLSLTHAAEYAPGTDERVYDTSRTVSTAPLVFAIPAADVFAPVGHGFPEMSMSELRASIAVERAAGGSARTQYLYFQQMFSFPVACLVFGLIGVPIGLHTRREGKLGGLVIGLGVVFLYYALMKCGESLTKAELLPAIWQRWIPNLILVPVGIAGLSWRTHAGVRSGAAWHTLLKRRRSGPVGSAARQTDLPVGSTSSSNWPGLRTLDRYVSSVYLRFAALAFFGLLALNYFGAVIDMSGHVVKHEATMTLVGRYLWYNTPQFMTWLVPMVALVTVLATIGSLTRTNELTVMRACGISLYRAALPLLGFGVLWSLLLFGLQETVLARANKTAGELRDEIRTGAPVQKVNINNDHWLADTNGRIYYYLGFETGAVPKLTGLSAFESARAPYRLRSHVYAASAEYRDGAWHAHDGWVQQFDGPDATRDAFGERVMELPPPESFGAARVDTSTMNFGQLQRQIRRLAAAGYNVDGQEVKLHGKIAFPLVGIVMTVLGIPFGITTGRRGALYGIGLAIILAFAYWLIAYVFVALGTAGILPPAIAAWATNILFLSAATYLTLTVRT